MQELNQIQTITDLGQALRSGSLDNKIFIANKTTKPIKVICSPNKDWILGDLGFSVATTAAIALATGGTGAAAGAKTATGVYKSLMSIYELYTVMKKAYSILSKLKKVGDAGMLSELKSNQEKLEAFFKESSKSVGPGEFELVNEKKIFSSGLGMVKYLYHANPLAQVAIENNATLKEFINGEKPEYSFSDFIDHAGNSLKLIEPSTFLSGFSGIGDITIFIATEDLGKTAIFNTNSRHSWIVNEKEVVRANYSNNQLQENRNEGWHFFGNTKSSKMDANEILYENDSMFTQTYNFQPLGEIIGEIKGDVAQPFEGNKSNVNDGDGLIFKNRQNHCIKR